MPIELKVPEVGESITEVMIGVWKKREGESVSADESIVEIESDKATVELPAPASGTIIRVLKASGEKARRASTRTTAPLAGATTGSACRSTLPARMVCAQVMRR